MKKLSLIFCIGVLLLVGCTSHKDLNTKEDNPVVKQSPDSDVDQPTKENETEKSGQSDLVALIDEVIKDDNVCDVSLFGKEVVMITIFKDTNYSSYFISVKEKAIVGKTNYNLQGGVLEYQAVGDYMVIYDMDNGHIITINKNYEVEDNFVIKEDFFSARIKNFCIMPKAKKIIYWDSGVDSQGPYCKIITSNFDGKKKKLLSRLDGNLENPKNINKLTAIDSGQLSDDEKQLYITGFYYNHGESGAEGKHGIGVMNLKNGKVSFHKQNKTQIKKINRGAVFYEMPQLEEKPTGKIIIMNASDKFKEIIFEKKEESETIFVSDQSSYLYTYVEHSTKKDSQPDKCVLTCYSLDSGKKLFMERFDYPIGKVMVLESENLMLCTYYDKDTKFRIMLMDAKRR